MDSKKFIKVILVDIVGLLVGIINGFLLPKFINIDSYAEIKTFALYISYSSMFHLGFCDGLYIKLGGKNLNEIKNKKIKGYFITLLKILFMVFILLYLTSILIVKDTIFNFFIAYTIPFQITLFITLLYRATGEFDNYVIIRVVINVFNLLSSLIMIMYNKSSYIYMCIQILGYMIIACFYSYKILLKYKKYERIQYREVKYLIDIGAIMLIANSISNLFFSLDRWVIKLKFSVNEFAYYSFGVSMMNLFVALISSIAVVFYPLLAQKDIKEKLINKVKKYIIIITSFAPAGYFVLEYIIRKYIQQYINSLNILGVLILCIPFIALINILYSNLYKILNMGKKYLKSVIKILMVAMLLNIIMYSIFNTTISIAYATLFSLIFWYSSSSKDFEFLYIKISEYLYFIIYIILYVIIKLLNINCLIKSVIFCMVIGVILYIFYKHEIKSLLNFLMNNITKNLNKTNNI